MRELNKIKYIKLIKKPLNSLECFFFFSFLHSFLYICQLNQFLLLTMHPFIVINVGLFCLR